MFRHVKSRTVALIAAAVVAGLNLLSPFASNARAAQFGGIEYASPADRRPLDGSYRYGPMTWTGLYAGVNLGWGGGGSDVSGALDQGIDAYGFLGGLHAGYNFQYHSIVAGLEGDFDWTTTEGDDSAAGNTFSAEANWLSSLRLRLGYAFDNLLIYGTGGIALAGYDLNISGGSTAGLSETLSGYAVGIGAEYAFTKSLIGRIEALHYDFSEDQFSIGGTATKADLDLTTIRAGISLKLN